MNIKEKLKGIGNIYYINLDSSIDRKKYMESQFKKYDIKNYTRISGFDCRNGSIKIEDFISGSIPENLTPAEIGCSISHLKAIKTWYYESDSPYAVIMEDDLMFDLVKYWGFTWEEFYEKIPYDWDVVQISVTSMLRWTIFLHKRFINDYSTVCYLINRHYAKKLIDLHIDGDRYKLDNGCKPRAVADDLIYNAGNTYSIPLLLSNVKFDSSIHQNHIDAVHKLSFDVTEHVWKTNSDKIKIENIMKYDPQILNYWQRLDSQNPVLNYKIAEALEKTIINIKKYEKNFLNKDK